MFSQGVCIGFVQVFIGLMQVCVSSLYSDWFLDIFAFVLQMFIGGWGVSSLASPEPGNSVSCLCLRCVRSGRAGARGSSISACLCSSCCSCCCCCARRVPAKKTILAAVLEKVIFKNVNGTICNVNTKGLAILA